MVPPAYAQYYLFATDPVLKELGFKPETPVDVEKYVKNVRETLRSPALVMQLAQDIEACNTGDPVDRDIINALKTAPR